MEKQTVTGLVEAVSEKNKSIKVGGEWYRLSSRTKGSLPQKGDEVHLVVNGDWVDEVEIVTNGKNGNGNGNGKNGARVTVHVRPQAENRLIAKQTALKAAVEIAVAAIQSGKAELNENLRNAVLGTAESFYGWLMNGDSHKK